MDAPETFPTEAPSDTDLKDAVVEYHRMSLELEQCGLLEDVQLVVMTSRSADPAFVSTAFALGSVA